MQIAIVDLLKALISRRDSDGKLHLSIHHSHDNAHRRPGKSMMVLTYMITSHGKHDAILLMKQYHTDHSTQEIF